MRVTVKALMMVAISAVLLLTGCATNRSVLTLSLPDTEIATQLNGGKVFINSVSDQRVFQENPRTQDIPSLGFGGAADATSELKKRAIGRKRNSYGKALGDMLLEENQNVETVIKNALQRSFTGLGYSVVDGEENIDNDTILVDATLEKFWAYVTPGFWAITLSSDISTNLKLIKKSSDGPNIKKVSVKSEGKYQVATESNWAQIINKSLEKYIIKTQEVVSNE